MVKSTVDAILKGAIGYINRAIDEVMLVSSKNKPSFISTARQAIYLIEKTREELKKL